LNPTTSVVGGCQAATPFPVVGLLMCMASSANTGDGGERGREIRLIENPDGQWTARDLDTEISAEGATRDAALVALDDVVAALDGESGHEPTDEEIRALGVDPDVARSDDGELPDALQ
jgi:hypothetical protein